MTTTTLTVFGAAALLAMTIASANAQKPAAPTVYPTGDQTQIEQSQTAQSQEKNAARSTPLFHIGNVGVGVWAPVEPVYDASTNRNLAANSLWSFGSPPAHTGF